MSIDLTTVFQLMPYAQNVAHADLVHPGASLVAAQTQAQQALAEQNKQTQPIEPQEGADAVGDEKQHEKPEHRQSKGRGQHRAEEEETQASNSTPFAGHIINMKV